MRLANKTEEIPNIIWKTGLTLLVVIAIVPVLQPRFRTYLLEESFLVMLTIAAVLVLIFIFYVVLMLLWEGMRLGFLWLKGKIGLLSEVRMNSGQPKLKQH